MFKTRLDTFGNDFGLFWIFEVFDFFENFRRLDPPWNTGQKFCFRKKHQNMFKTRLDTFGNDFGHFWSFGNFLIFLKIFEDSLDRPWNTGQKTFSKKSPENMFKTRLDTFGNDFGHFRNFEKFLIFLKIFEDSTLHGTLGKSFVFEKNTPKHVQNTFGHFWERFWAFLEFWKFFDFFENFRRLTRPSMEHWAKNFFEKIT